MPDSLDRRWTATRLGKIDNRCRVALQALTLRWTLLMQSTRSVHMWLCAVQRIGLKRCNAT